MKTPRLLLHNSTGALLLLVFVASSPAAELTLSALDRDPLMRRAIIDRLAKTPDHHIRFAPSGAGSSNIDYEQKRTDKWFIEGQRYGADLVEAGLVAGDRALVDFGWKMLDWGFARQQADGGFGDTGDPFHSTSFFVEAAARAVLLSREMGDPNAAKQKARYGPKIAAAARWMRQPEVLKRGLKNNQPYTHRRWVVAAAWGLAAAVVADEPQRQDAAELAREGLALQKPDGVNPEKDGFDVSYQAVGLVFAARYYTVCTDVPLRREIAAMLNRGLKWEQQKIDADGEVQREGSTRVNSEVSRSGTAKTVDYKAIVTAFDYGAQITGHQEFQAVAEGIARHVRWIKD